MGKMALLIVALATAAMAAMITGTLLVRAWHEATEHAGASSDSCGPTQFVFSNYALMGLVHALDAILEYFVFCLRQ
jgi:hypothetical protein